MNRRPPRSTRTDTLFPYTTLFRSATASTDGEVAPADKAAKRPPAIKPMDVPTRGGDGSPIELAALTEADVSGAKLKGELACSFADDEGAQPILLAKGDVASEEPSRRSGERRVGKECVRTCRSRWSQYH